jgi:hypothetical protein
MKRTPLRPGAPLKRSQKTSTSATRLIHTTQLPQFYDLVHQLRDSAYHDGLRGQISYSPQTIALAQILEHVVEAYRAAGSVSVEYSPPVPHPHQVHSPSRRGAQK